MFLGKAFGLRNVYIAEHSHPPTGVKGKIPHLLNQGKSFDNISKDSGGMLRQRILLIKLFGFLR
jgi:hypothetical protein